MNETQDPGQDRLLEHNYDGIQEYDNPMPGWWVYLFWATIVFAALYWFNVPGIGSGRGRIANYEADMARARAKADASAPAPAPVLDDAALLALAREPAKLEAGKATFVTNCTPCHRADGGGNIGPNLTDEYWIHGGRPSQILATINTGVPDKGMPAWGQMLKPAEVPAVAAYVLTLRGTHPPSPKGPQGVKEDPEAAKSR